LQTLGSDMYGGKKYLILLSAIIGFFAITSQVIPPKRASLYVGLFFLGSATLSVGELLPVLSPSLYFIFMIFPVSGFSGMGASTVTGAPIIARLSGLAQAGLALFLWMLCRYGIAELFTWKRLGRLLVFLTAIVMGLLGGYRGILVLFILTFAVLF